MSYVINTKLVYIVDDERALQIGVREVIRRAGLEIEIETFYDPNEAFEALESGKNVPLHIITDRDMPEVCGEDFATELRKRYENDVKIFLCTGNEAAYDAIKEREGLVDRLHMKPVGISEIISFLTDSE